MQFQPVLFWPISIGKTAANGVTGFTSFLTTSSYLGFSSFHFIILKRAEEYYRVYSSVHIN